MQAPDFKRVRVNLYRNWIRAAGDTSDVMKRIADLEAQNEQLTAETEQLVIGRQSVLEKTIALTKEQREFILRCDTQIAVNNALFSLNVDDMDSIIWAADEWNGTK